MAVFGSLRTRLKKRVLASLATDPAWTVLVHGKDWLCPYCTQVGVEKLPEDEASRVEAILDHLVETPCPNLHLGEGTTRPLTELKREASIRELRRRVKRELARNPGWQLLDIRRYWYCPFCGEPSDVLIPADQKMTEEVLRDLVLHVESCFAYSHGKGEELPLEKLKATVKNANRSRKLAEDVRKKLEGDPLWRQKDPRARWLCPFCMKVIEHVDLSTNLLMFENAPALIAKHLLSPCERWKNGAPPRMVGAKGEATPVLRPAEDTRGSSDERSASSRAKGKPRSDVWGRDAELSATARDEQSQRPAQRTLRQLESSGEFHLIDDPEVRKLVSSRPVRASDSRSRSESTPSTSDSRSAEKAGDISSSAEWRRAIERELAAVREAVPGALEASGGSLEDTEQADAREAARAADTLPGFELRVLVRAAQPARGDFVEVLKLDANRLGLLLGGVSGGDQEGALVSAMARNLLRIHARKERDPANVLRRVNADMFQDLDARTFVSACYAILDGAKKQLVLARAGLTAPVLLNPARNPPFQLIESEGMVMGIDKGAIFDQTVATRTVDLSPGDLVVLASNGILEVRGKQREELGLERFHHALRRFGNHEAEYLTHKIAQLLEDFAKDGDPSADACVLALRLAPGGR